MTSLNWLHGHLVVKAYIIEFFSHGCHLLVQWISKQSDCKYFNTLVSDNYMVWNGVFSTYMIDILQKFTRLSLIFQSDYIDSTTIHNLVEAKIVSIDKEFSIK
jgi:hypothetical protein